MPSAERKTTSSGSSKPTIRRGANSHPLVTEGPRSHRIAVWWAALRPITLRNGRGEIVLGQAERPYCDDAALREGKNTPACVGQIGPMAALCVSIRAASLVCYGES